LKTEWKAPRFSPGTDLLTEGAGSACLDVDDRRIRELFPEFRRIISLPGQSIWEGILQPFAQTYFVRLTWTLGVCGPETRTAYCSPRVFVLHPKLEPLRDCPASRIPHLYKRPSADLPQHLCLYWPLGHEFHSSMYLAHTVLPWATEWLGYYELWHATGAWHGSEAPHSRDQLIEEPVAAAERRSDATPRVAALGSLFDAHPYLIHRYHKVGQSKSTDEHALGDRANGAQSATGLDVVAA
jgi:hypothetical protein